MLYGRDVERARIGALLEAARASRSGALVVRGEPGIGKSALLQDTRDRAPGMNVLAANGVESEFELPFGAVHQLLRPALGHLDRIPAPQAAALRCAFGFSDGGTPEPFLVFSACLSLLSELSEQRPVLCLVDDAHWLDAASADALRFVARRLDAEGIVILFATREGDVRGFDAPDIPSLVLEGLDADAAGLVLRRGLGVDAAQSVRDQLVAQTRGNALALLEIPSVLTDGQLAGTEPLPEALPLTRQVESVFLERVRRLPEETQRLLLVAAADDSGNVGFVTRAAGSLGASARALDMAEARGLVVVRGTQFEFRHPLVRSAVYGAATSSDRRAAHRALADALTRDDENADRRAWHLAASALEYDEAVVRALEEAAERAEDRAAYMTAARALERAAELSDDDAARGRRLGGAARCASVAGADDRAVAFANRAARVADEPLARAELAHVVGLAELRRGRPAAAVSKLTDAARKISSTDPGKALELLLDASWAAGEGAGAEALAEIRKMAATVTPPAGDDTSRFICNVLTGIGALTEGDTERGAGLIEPVLAWAARTENPRHVVWGGSAALWLGDAERAEALFSRGASLARERGAIGILPPALRLSGVQHFFAQRFDAAVLACTEAVQLARDVGADNQIPVPLAILAKVAAIRGDYEDARRRAHEALERATAHGLGLAEGWAGWALATIDLGNGVWLEALERLESLATQQLAGFTRFLVIQTTPDRIEAAVRAGRRERGKAALATFEGWAAHSGAAGAHARLASCRALLAEGDQATEHHEEALRLGSSAGPFDLARIQLLYGEHLRRVRRRTDARSHLRAALEGFERVRAEPWAERARSELRASGETARKRDPSTLGQLTPQELQIARYVAEGLSNKEVAAQMFLSPRTIESHLRSVFAKLAITSRTQLARLQLDDAAAA